jgi:hypothetical protein
MGSNVVYSKATQGGKYLPRKKAQDWKKISTDLSAAICELAAQLEGRQQNALTKRLMVVIRHYQEHPRTDYMIDALSDTLKPLDMDLGTKAELLNKILAIVQNFFNIQPLWHTSGADQ